MAKRSPRQVRGPSLKGKYAKRLPFFRWGSNRVGSKPSGLSHNAGRRCTANMFSMPLVPAVSLRPQKLSSATATREKVHSGGSRGRVSSKNMRDERTEARGGGQECV